VVRHVKKIDCSTFEILQPFMIQPIRRSRIESKKARSKHIIPNSLPVTTLRCCMELLMAPSK
jgi:hypothetical protein